MHRLRLCCIALGLLACSRGEQSTAQPWLTDLSPAEHDRFFPIQTGPHALSCNACHGTTDSFKHFDCTTCHTQPPTTSLHAGMATFRWENASCYACHPRGISTYSAAEHASYFPIGTGLAHALGASAVLVPGSISCGSCHTTVDRAQFDCTTCHTQASMTSPAGRAFHASVPDLAAGPSAGSSSQCLVCHSDGGVPVSVTWSAKAPSHDQKYGFEVTPGSVHAGLPCLTCHSQRKPIASTGFSGADFAQETCTACHSPTPFGSLGQEIDRAHLGLGEFNGYTYANLSNPPVPADSRSCLNCHTHGRIENFDHSLWFPIARADTHAMGKSFSTASSGLVTVTCSACHQDPASRQNVTCTSCHTATGTNAAGPNPIDLASAHTGLLGGTSWQGTARPTSQCLLCHTNDSLERVRVHGIGSSSYSSDFPGTLFSISSGNHFVACESCHRAQVTDGNLKNPRIDFNQRSCDSCHNEAREKLVTNHAGIGLAIQDAAGPNSARTCLQCHADGGPAPATVAYAHPYFPVDAAARHPMGQTVARAGGGAVTFSCSSCHVTRNDFAQVDCTTCHSQASMTSGGTSAHASVPDVPASFAAGTKTSVDLCLQCHADGKVPVSLTWSTSKVGTHDALYSFRVSAGTPHATTKTNPNERCSTCHSMTRPIAGVTTATAETISTIDFKQQTCTACHAPTGLLTQNVDQIHAGFGTVNVGGLGYSYVNLSNPPLPADSKRCLNCHRDGSRGNFDHGRWFPIAGNETHALGRAFAVSGSATQVTLACATCHQDMASRRDVTCTTCHTPAGTNSAGPNAIDLRPAHQSQLGGSNWRAPNAPTPQCLLCHAKDFLERVNVHGSGSPGAQRIPFVIDATSTTHFVPCEQCHTARVTTDPDLQNPQTDFNVQICNNCHGEVKDRLVSIHALLNVTPPVVDTVDALGNPVPDHAKQCRSCHPDGRAAPLNQLNHPYFPVTLGSHAMGKPAVHAQGQVQCASCHAALTTDPAKIDCTTRCHTQAQMTTASGVAFHAAVPDLIWPNPATPQETSLLCLKCHADSKVPASVSYSTTSNKGKHDPSNAAIVFNVTPGSRHDTSKLSMPCLTCHSSATTPFPAVPAMGIADFTQQSCTSCHSRAGTLAQDLDALHVGVTIPAPGYQPVPDTVTPAYSKTCLPCHANGQVDQAIAAQNHVGFFPIAPTDSHAYLGTVTVSGRSVVTACAACHVDTSTRQNVDCTGCHIQSGNGPLGPGVPADQTFAHSGKVATTPSNLWLGTGPVAAGASARCLLCHSNDARPAGFVAKHGQAGPAQTVFGIGPASGSHFTACDQCHSVKVVDPKRKNAEFDFARASCDMCHLASGPGSVVAAHQALGVPFTAPYAAGDPNNSSACLGCHPNGGRAPSSVPYTHVYFPVAAGSIHAMGAPAMHVPGQFQCASCHTTLISDPAKIDCTGCHTQAQMTTAGGISFHASVPDLSWPNPASPQQTSLVCLNCHSDGNVPASVSYSAISNKGKHDPSNAAIVFNVTPGSRHDTSRPSMPCLTCHPSVTTPFPAVPAMGSADFTQQSCTTCHSRAGTLAQDLDSLHVGVTTPAPGYQPVPSPATAAYSKTCLPCHANGQVDPAIAAQNHAGLFPIGSADSHALGKSFAVSGSPALVILACATCHQNVSNRQDVTCTTCHTSAGTNAAGPNAIDLAPAHAARLAGISWQATAGPTSQCLLCHANDFLERVSVHGSGSSPIYPSDFPGKIFAIGSGPHFAACETCHTSQATDPGFRNPRIDFNQRSCDSCHSQAKDRVVTIHAGIGILIQDPSGPISAGACLQCHPDGGRAPNTVVYSHSYFPVDSAAPHAMGQTVPHGGGTVTFSCSSCHVTRNDFAQVDCTTCHSQASMTSGSTSAHALVPDVPTPFAPGTETSMGLCLQCHADGNVPVSLTYSLAKAATHDSRYAFLISAGSRHATTNTNPSEKCSTCHSVTKPIVGVTTATGGTITTTDFTQQTCTACHAPAGALSQNVDLIHAGFGTVTVGGIGYTYRNLSSPPQPADSKSCLNCHRDGNAGTFDHASWFPITSTDTHALRKTFTVSGATVTLACATCHQDVANRQDVTCTTCHTSTGANAAGPNAIDLAPAHASRLAGTNWQAAPGPTRQCLLCHANDFLERVNVHGSGSPPVYPSDFPGTTFVIAGGKHFAACETCHASQVTDPNFKNPRTDFAERSCDGCHSQAKDRVVTNHFGIGVLIQDPAGANNAAACLKCHPDGGRAPASVPYSHPFFPVDSAAKHPMGDTVVRAGGGAVTFSCSSCHVTPTDFAQVDCTTCHSQASMTSGSTSAHALVPDVPSPFTPGTQTSVSLCLQCHADGKVPVSLIWSTAKAGTHDALCTFKVSAGSHHATTNTNPSEKCLTCHSVTQAISGATMANGGLITTTDFKQQTCTACHAPVPTGALAQNIDQLHAGLGTITVGGTSYTYQNLSGPPVPADSKICLHCHPDGSIGNFDHSKWFPIASADTHALGKLVTVSGSPTPVKLACVTCHQDSASRPSVTCTTCHTPGGTNASRANAVDLIPAHASQLGGSNWLVPSTPTPQCLLCHAKDFLERVNVHGSGSTPVYQSDAPGIPFVIDATSTTHFVACEQCHTVQVTTDPQLQNLRTDFNARSCNNCHGEAKDRLVTIHNLLSVAPPVGDTVDAGGSPVPGHAKQCLACHPDGGAAPLTVPYSHPYFPIGSGNVHAMGTPAVHAQGQFQCSSCHTALGSDPARVDCTGCHNQAQMTVSIGFTFHDSVPDLTWPDPAKPEATSLLCLKCHADSAVPASVSYSTQSKKGKHDPSNAAIVFNVAPGAPHDTSKPSMRCLTCHSSTTIPFSTIPAMERTEFAEQSCTNCHSLGGALAQDLDKIHVGVTTPPPGYQPVPSAPTPAYSKTCLPCHANGQIDPLIAARNHAGFFPIAAADSHAYGRMVTVLTQSFVTACASCHVDTGNRPNVDCTGCHVVVGNGVPRPGVPADQMTAHSGKVATTPYNPWLGLGPVGLGDGASARCLLCHGNDARTAGFVVTHGQAGPARTVFRIDPTARSHFTSCDQCHRARLVDPRRKNAELDFAQASCDACHLTAGPENIVATHQAFGAPITAPYVAGEPNNSSACLGCHPDGGTAAGFTHPWFPIKLSDVHNAGATTCAQCHSSAASYQGDPTNNLPLITCTGCHNDAPANLLYQNGFTITQIHTTPRVGSNIWNIPGGYDYSNNLLCFACHAGNIRADLSLSPLVFRLSVHDARCQRISGGEHRVSRNTDIPPIVNICFGCHNQKLSAGGTPWAVDWTFASPTASCAKCHEHAVSPPSAVTCR